VVLSKVDLVTPAQLQAVIGVVKALNPGAEIIHAEQGRVALNKLLGTGKFNLERASAMAGWAQALAGEHTPETEEYGIGSFVLRSREPLHSQRFSDFLALPFSGLLRAKGYVWLASRPQWALSYSRAGNTATLEPVGQWWAAVAPEQLPEHGSAQRAAIDACWAEPYGDRINEVVFIGCNMDRTEIERAFHAAQLTPAEIRQGVSYWSKLADPFPDWEQIARQQAEADAAQEAAALLA
jgi:G3E family GTPase